MIEIKTCILHNKINYIKIPVTQTSDINEFNKVYKYFTDLRKQGLINYGIIRTKSGAISIKRKNLYYELPAYEITAKNNQGAELLVLYCDVQGNTFCFRLQFNTLLKQVNEEKTIASGKICFRKFINELRKDGVKEKDIKKYFTDNGEEINKTIEKPIVKCLKDHYIDKTYISCHHIDIHNSYPSGVAEFCPEWKPTIKRLYKDRKIHPDNKLILNASCGYMHSKYFAYKGANIAKYFIQRNNEKIRCMLKQLRDTGRIPILINTDGIWFCGESTNLHNKNLGRFEEDHTNCQLRVKSKGCYEFIENGKYYPVVRGSTNYDKIQPDRSKWQWGDIYRNDAIPIRYVIDKELGIIEQKLTDEELALLEMIENLNK